MTTLDFREEGISLSIKLDEAVRIEAQAHQEHDSDNGEVKFLVEEHRLELKREWEESTSSRSSIFASTKRARFLVLAQKRATRILTRSKRRLDEMRAVVRDLRRQVAENRISLQQLEQSTNGIANELHDSGDVNLSSWALDGASAAFGVIKAHLLASPEGGMILYGANLAATAAAMTRRRDSSAHFARRFAWMQMAAETAIHISATATDSSTKQYSQRGQDAGFAYKGASTTKSKTQAAAARRGDKEIVKGSRPSGGYQTGHDKSEVLEVAKLKAKVAQLNTKVAQLNTELAESKAHIQATQMVVAASPLRSQNELRAKVEGPVVATCTERKFSNSKDCKSLDTAPMQVLPGDSLLTSSARDILEQASHELTQGMQVLTQEEQVEDSLGESKLSCPVPQAVLTLKSVEKNMKVVLKVGNIQPKQSVTATANAKASANTSVRAPRFDLRVHTADTSSPISETNSKCAQFWRSEEGPTGKGSDKTAAEYWLNRGLKKYVSDSGGKNGWAIGYKYGCTPIVSQRQNRVMKICGCYELWCGIRGWQLNAPDDNRKCHSARQIFGCHCSGDGANCDGYSFGWRPNCAYGGAHDLAADGINYHDPWPHYDQLVF